MSNTDPLVTEPDQQGQGEKKEGVKKPEVNTTEKIKLTQDRISKNQKRIDTEKRHSGIVTSVPSGDSVRIIPSHVLYQNGGEPKTILLKLNGVKAPQLERTTYLDDDKDKEKEQTEEIVDENSEKKDKKKKSIKHPDEAFAWSSREFLRERLIGKPVIYQKSFKINQGSFFGDIWIFEDNEVVNIREECIVNGWVEVQRRPELTNKESKDGKESVVVLEYKRIVQLEKEAETLGLGVHCKSKAKANASIRHVHKHEFKQKDNKAAYELFEKIKEIPQHGVVEKVISGTTLRIILLDRMDEITVQLAGVQSPLSQDTYGYEAKMFTSHFLLNRDVIVYLELMDSMNKFYATVKLKDNPDFDLTIELLRGGLARLVDWSVSKGAYIAELQAAEEYAKLEKTKMWEQFKEKSIGQSSNKTQFNGKVVEVIDSGTFNVVAKGGSKIVRIRMSSLKPLYRNLPQNHNETKTTDEIRAENEKNKAFSFHGQDFTRKLLIGKKVTCIEDYSFGDNKFYSVFLKDLNVSLRILEEGWARIQPHSNDSERSPQYQQMVLAYNRASKSGRGVHGSINNAQVHFNDLSAKKEDKQKTAMFLGFLQRAGRVVAVVERVLSGSTYILRIPSENNCRLRFKNEGIWSEPTSIDKEAKVQADTVGNRALEFSKRNLFQRDVEVIVSSVDGRGSFFGRLYNGNKDYAYSLLDEGLARIDLNTAVTMDEFEKYRESEKKAKIVGKNIWEEYDAEAEEKKKEERKEKRDKDREATKEQFGLIITEILDGSHFWFQKVSQLDALNEMMSLVEAENLEANEAYIPKPSEFVFAKFAGDGKYYRTTVTRLRETEEKEKLYSVLFVDYGNVQVTKSENIRRLDVSKFGLKVWPAQAKEGRLAYVRTPKLHEEFGYESASLFKELVYEKSTLIASGVSKDKEGREALNIGDENTRIYVNSALVAAGLGMVEKQRKKTTILHKQLNELESQAKIDHMNIWKHGEPPDSEEEREEEKRRKGLL